MVDSDQLCTKYSDIRALLRSSLPSRSVSGPFCSTRLRGCRNYALARTSTKLKFHQYLYSPFHTKSPNIISAANTLVMLGLFFCLVKTIVCLQYRRSDLLSIKIDCLLSDPSLTPSNMRTALDTLPADKWRMFGGGLYVPQYTLDQIRSQFTSDEERKDELIRIYHTEHPFPTWEHVSEVLYWCGRIYDDQEFPNVLDSLQSMFPTGKSVSPSQQLLKGLGFHIIRRVALANLVYSFAIFKHLAGELRIDCRGDHKTSTTRSTVYLSIWQKLATVPNNVSSSCH